MAATTALIALSPRSLTLRLTALFAAVSTAVLIAIGYVLGTAMDVHFRHEDAMELRAKTELIAHMLARMRGEGDFAQLEQRLEEALIGHHSLFVSIRDPAGRLLFATPADASPVDEVARNPATQSFDGVPIATERVAGHLYRVTSSMQGTALAGLPDVRVTIAINIDHHEEFMEAMRRTVWLAVAIGALLAVVFGSLAARVGLAPVRSLAALTSRTSASRLNARVDADHLPPELADLGKSFNDMLSRLEDSFRRLNEFSSDLAHELRTPITNLLTQAQVALSRSRSADDYREVMYSAIEEYDRLARMITDMLFLAKADNGLLVPAHEPVDLRAETEALFEFYDALVEAQNVKLAVHGNATVPGDRIMLRRALSNLLANAIRHTPAGGAVEVTIAPEASAGASIAVSNPGPTIAPEHLPRLFDRFYRVDPARQRSGEGAGLGLAITRTIVTAHGGTISVRSEDGLTRFEIRLPAFVAAEPWQKLPSR